MAIVPLCFSRDCFGIGYPKSVMFVFFQRFWEISKMFCVQTGNIFGFFSSFYVFFHCNGIPLKLTETTMLTFTVTLSRKLSIIRGDVNISHRQPQKVPKK